MIVCCKRPRATNQRREFSIIRYVIILISDIPKLIELTKISIKYLNDSSTQALRYGRFSSDVYLIPYGFVDFLDKFSLDLWKSSQIIMIILIITIIIIFLN